MRYEMRLNKLPFGQIVDGKKTIEVRLNDAKRKLLAVGDEILFSNRDNPNQTIIKTIKDLRLYNSFAEMANNGVYSFKIEGRMRRPEYVAAATRYYRAILDEQGNLSGRLSDLKRTYNRGNYTKGLAFGQDKRFLSTAIQGHLGEKVGVVKVVSGQYLVESRFTPQKGDAFKIIRDGEEIGGAVYIKTQGKSFVIDSKNRLKNGDGVFVTTDTYR